MIEIKYFEDGKLFGAIRFADLDEANDNMYMLFWDYYEPEYRERVDRGFATREEIVDFLNSCEGGDLFRWEIYPQSTDWKFV